MPNFELIEKKDPKNLVKEDHIIIDNEFWRVIENYQILGSGQMLVLAHVEHLMPRSYKFYEIKFSQARMQAFKRTD